MWVSSISTQRPPGDSPTSLGSLFQCFTVFQWRFLFYFFPLISKLNLLWCNFRSVYSKRSFGLGVPLFSEATCKTYEQVGESNQWMPSVSQLRNPHFWGVCALWLNLLCFWLSFSLIWTVTATVHTHQLGSNLSFLPSCLVLRNLQKFSIFETVSSLWEIWLKQVT